ncbi:MAG: hypothetical protein WAM79_12645 [Candidatus Sulfotelmatobacter sp.]
MDMLFDLLVEFVKGIWRAVKVKRTAPDENHTATEYADAFLFPEDDPGAPNSSDPPTILDRRH